MGIMVAVGRGVGEGIAKPDVHPATSKAKIEAGRR
jgi:hypothetical protein